MSDPELDDLEEGEETAKERRKKQIIWTCVVLVLSVIAIGIGAKACRGTAKDAARIALRTEVARFENSPLDEEAYNSAVAALEKAGPKAKEELDRIKKVREDAVARQGKDLEQALRARLAQNTADDDALAKLVDILVKRKDLQGARDVYAAAIAKSPTPKRHQTFGSWAYRNGFSDVAAKELEAALKGGIEDPYVHGYYGLALADQGKKKEARHELNKALEDGAELDLISRTLYAIEDEIGQEPDPSAKPAPKAKPAKKK